jgi:hypothetical protein
MAQKGCVQGLVAMKQFYENLTRLLSMVNVRVYFKVINQKIQYGLALMQGGRCFKIHGSS